MENVDKIKNACNELYCLVYDEVKKHYYCPDEVVKEAFVKVDELIAELESKNKPKEHVVTTGEYEDKVLEYADGTFEAFWFNVDGDIVSEKCNSLNEAAEVLERVHSCPLKNGEYTFKLYVGKNGKCHERTHHCANIEEAKQQLVGMVYSMFFLYKRPSGELWQDGKMIYHIN